MKDRAFLFERAAGGMRSPPSAMAALRRAVINTRGCGIGRQGTFERSNDNGRVHDEDVFSLSE